MRCSVSPGEDARLERGFPGLPRANTETATGNRKDIRDGIGISFNPKGSRELLGGRPRFDLWGNQAGRQEATRRNKESQHHGWVLILRFGSRFRAPPAVFGLSSIYCYFTFIDYPSRYHVSRSRPRRCRSRAAPSGQDGPGAAGTSFGSPIGSSEKRGPSNFLIYIKRCVHFYYYY